METIKATYTAKMTKAWFLEFLHMLASCNAGITIEISETGLKLYRVIGSDRVAYLLTVTFGTPMEVTRDEWLKKLNKHILDVERKG